MMMRDGKCRQRCAVHLAIRRQPVRPHLQHQVGISADQAQGVCQVVAIDGGEGPPVSLGEAINQQCGVGCHRVAFHQPETTADVVLRVDR